MYKAICFGMVACWFTSCSTVENQRQSIPLMVIPDGIVEKMHQQEMAWNRGDVTSFMEIAYWPDDSLVFIGSKGPTYGFQETLSNYQNSYPDVAAMGVLQFELLHWKPLGSNHGLLIGSWRLNRADSLGNLSGHFSLTWERQGDEWLIIADHSS